MTAAISGLVCLAVWSIFFVISYTMSAFNERFDPMWYLPGSTLAIAVSIALAWRKSRRAVLWTVAVVGLCSCVLPARYLYREGYQEVGYGVAKRQALWQKALVASLAVVVAGGSVGALKRDVQKRKAA